MAKPDEIFRGITPVASADADEPVYAVKPLPGYPNYFIGKDTESHACLFIVTKDERKTRPSPLRFESLDAHFNLRCNLRRGEEPDYEDTFTVIKCRSLESETVRYFLSICETVVRLIGDEPSYSQISSAVHRLAEILQKTRNPPGRSVNGLFGELFVLSRSANPVRALRAWRVDDMSRFDFIDGDMRLDVKTANGRARVHTFSYDQCNPPTGTTAVVASLFVQRVSTGTQLRSLIEDIEGKVAAHSDLVLKLHDVVAGTLGTHVSEALLTSFDLQLAESSLSFFEVSDIPAVRDPLPAGVTDVHFRSDLSGSNVVSPHELIDREPSFHDLLPFAQD